MSDDKARRLGRGGVWLYLDARTHDHGAVAGQAEVVGGIGGDLRRGQKQGLAPAAHSGRVAAIEVDGGEEVRRLTRVDDALRLCIFELAQHRWDVGLVHVPEAG